eukprot:9989391-Ditylum_brightwellii.AAC.1
MMPMPRSPTAKPDTPSLLTLAKPSSSPSLEQANLAKSFTIQQRGLIFSESLIALSLEEVWRPMSILKAKGKREETMLRCFY